MKIRVFEGFAGYGSQALALKRLAHDYHNWSWSLWVSRRLRKALSSLSCVHGDVKNYGDISHIDWSEVSDFDLFTYSFPCQDISNAGLQKGLQEGSGTRSSLLWECRRAIEAKRPKWLLMEKCESPDATEISSFLSGVDGNTGGLRIQELLPDTQRKGLRRSTKSRVYLLEQRGTDDIDNLMPSCRMCNFYKERTSIEGFRSKLKNLLDYKRTFATRMALKYGILVEKGWDGKFYFEKEK